MYECFHCGKRAVGWEIDFNFEDYGIDGDGIVHVCRCNNCDAEILYFIRIDEPEDSIEVE